MDTTKMVNRLKIRAYNEDENLRESAFRFGEHSPHIGEDALDSATLIVDSFLESGGPKAMLTMINFSTEKFTGLWGRGGVEETETELALTMGRWRT